MSDKTITIISIVLPCLVVVAGIGLWFLEQAAQEVEMWDRDDHWGRKDDHEQKEKL
jgi:hypothetical protein